MRAIVIARRLGTCLQRATVTGLAASGETAVASGWFRPGQILPRGRPRKERGLRRWRIRAGGLGQRHGCLDLVAVTAAVFPLDHVAGGGPAGDYATGAAFCDAQ